jgi:hypothetical protein
MSNWINRNTESPKDTPCRNIEIQYFSPDHKIICGEISVSLIDAINFTHWREIYRSSDDVVATAEEEISIFERPSRQTSLALVSELKLLRGLVKSVINHCSNGNQHCPHLAALQDKLY